MKPNPEFAKAGRARRAPFAIVLAVATLLALPIVASATHFPNFGGDAGHSGNQPVNQAEMSVQSLYRQTDAGAVRTSLVMSGGDAATGQRISYGKFIDVPDSANDETRIHIRDLATGEEKVPAAQQVIDADSSGDGAGLDSDDRTLGTGSNFVTPVSSSTDGGLGQLFVVHNDANSTAAASNGCNPVSVTSASNNDIAIAQFDEATGAKKKDVAIGVARGDSTDPTCSTASRPQVTNEYMIESSPVITPPLDGSGRRLLFFVARSQSATPGPGRLFRVEINNAGSPDAEVVALTPQFRDIPGLNTTASPAVAYFRDPASGFVIPYVVVAVNAAPGASDVRAFKAEDISAGEVDLEAPADVAGDPQAISIPSTEDGQLPGPASGDEKAPAMYVSYKDGEATRVHRFTQTGSNEQFTDTVANPPALDGTPGPGMALSQVVSGGDEQDGRVIVSTSKNLFALSLTTLAPVERLRDEGESLLEAGVSGFSRNAPLTSGGFVFIQDDTGIPYVLDLSDLERVDETDFTPESSHLEADFTLGQPAYSNGFLSFLNDRGLYTYQTGVVIPPNEPPVARFSAAPNPAAIGQQITFDASTSSDPDGKGIAKYEWDFDGNGTYEVDKGSDPKIAVAFPAAGTFTVGLRVTDVSPGQGSPVKTGTTTQQIVINPPPPNQNPVAAFTFTPAQPVVDTRVTFDATTSKDPDGGTIQRYEWDLDGNGTFETNSGNNPRVQRSYSKAAVYNVKLRVTDNANGAGEVVRQVVVGRGVVKRKLPRRLTAKVTPMRDVLLPYDFRTTGRLTRPSGVSKKAGCRGRVTVTVKAGKKTISRRTTRLRSNCTYTNKVRFRDAKRFGTANALRFTARFQGNAALRARQATSVKVRVR